MKDSLLVIGAARSGLAAADPRPGERLASLDHGRQA